MYVEKEETQVEIHEGHEISRLNAFLLREGLKMQTKAISRLEIKVSEKDNEIKDLHEDRKKMHNFLIQYNVDRGQLHIHQLIFDKNNITTSRKLVGNSFCPYC